MKSQTGKPRWDVKKLNAVRQKAENIVEVNLRGRMWNWECESAAENINKFVLDTVIGLVGKVERRRR
jgi:hypothetical protein